MFSRILVAYNGSRGSKQVLAQAKGLQPYLQTETHVLAVASLAASLYVAEGYVPMEFVDDEKIRGHQVLDEGLAQLRLRGFTNLTGHVAVGDPVEQISRVAAELQCDLIIVGHTHRPMMSRWWQRSVGKSLLDQTHCAMLVLRTPE